MYICSRIIKNINVGASNGFSCYLLHFEDGVYKLVDDPQTWHSLRVVGLPLILQLENKQQIKINTGVHR
jgi:hypothetical protein